MGYWDVETDADTSSLVHSWQTAGVWTNCGAKCYFVCSYGNPTPVAQSVILRLSDHNLTDRGTGLPDGRC